MTDSSGQEQHLQPDVFRVDCGSRRVLDLIADTWSILVLYALETEALRYTELNLKIEGISQKMLTQTLRRLERNGLVIRVADENRSARVRYALSDIGQTLLTPLGGLCEWSQDHMTDVEAARTAFDHETS